MPGFLNPTVLLGLLAAGGAIGVALLLLVATRQALRDLTRRRQDRLDSTVRPLILRAVKSHRIPLDVVQARGRRGRSADRVTYRYLAQVRGGAHDLLAEILERRGTAAHTIRRTSKRRAHVRACAAGLLGRIASPAAQVRLEQLLRDDPSVRVRIVAARALGEVEMPGAATALLQAVDEDGTNAVPEGVIASSLLAQGMTAAPALRQAAQDPGRPFRQAMAMDLLGLLKDLAAWQIVADNTCSADPQVRLSAVGALGELGLRKAAHTLLACLTEGNETGVRSAAAWALGRIRDPASVAALARCLGDPDHRVAHNAALALAAHGKAGEHVLTQMATGDGPTAAHAREALAHGARPTGPRAPAAQPPALDRPGYPRVRPPGRGG
jgi:HEAT repeat protein